MLFKKHIYLLNISETQEINSIKLLLGEEHIEYVEYIKAERKANRCSGMATAEAALQKCFIKLQTAVSKKHNDVKKLLLQNPNNKKLLCEKKMAEQLMKSWNFYFY